MMDDKDVIDDNNEDNRKSSSQQISNTDDDDDEEDEEPFPMPLHEERTSSSSATSHRGQQQQQQQQQQHAATNEIGTESSTDAASAPADATAAAATGSKTSKNKPNKKEKKFPWILHKIIEDAEREGNQHIVAWMPSGRSFVVYKRDEFMERILPRYFRQTKYKSFVRQLNLWGFTYIDQGPDRGSCTYLHHPRANMIRS
jgi:HSF-type DNA-binding